MSKPFYCVVLFVIMLSACSRMARPMDPGPMECPRPDAAGMSQRLAERFFQMSRDTLRRGMLLGQDIDPAQVTEPALATDERLCGRIASTFGFPVPGAAEGGAFYISGPYILYSPWRDYNRRAEWGNKSEFVPFLVLDRNMKVIGAIGM